VEDGIRGVPHRLRVLKVKAYVEWRKPTCSLQGACCSVPISWRRAWGPIIPQGPLTLSNLRWRVSTVNTGNLERVTDGARTRDLRSHNPMPLVLARPAVSGHLAYSWAFRRFRGMLLSAAY
jgi:hypothetical protein